MNLPRRLSHTAPDTATAYREACMLDVEACKPGNVSIEAAGHGMTARQFLHSAEYSAPILANPELPLGECIFKAVAATQAAVGCNTNLGIVLLCAPLMQAAHTCAADLCGWRRQLHLLLRRSTRDDARWVYGAIRLANPGGLGSSDRHDVAADPEVSLLDTMRHAAARDHIARLYATDFRFLFEDALPWFDSAYRHWGDVHLAVSDLYLYLLARSPDSHVWRKQGEKIARQVSAEAETVRREFLDAETTDDASVCLQAFDRHLKADAINPGTTADLVVATLLLSRLHAVSGSDPPGTPG